MAHLLLHLDQMVKVTGWQTLSPWTAAQKVQGSPSSDGGIYRDSYQRAAAIVAALNTRPAASADSPSGTLVQAAVSDSGCGQPARIVDWPRVSGVGWLPERADPGQRALPRPVRADPATRMRRRKRLQPAQHRLQHRHWAEHWHHRRLPPLRRTGPMPPREGQPVRQPRHVKPRLGQSGRHRRLLRHQHRSRPRVRLAHRQRQPLRLERPRLGASWRLET